MLRIPKHKVWAIVAGAVSLMVVSSAMAEQKVPIKLAVQTTIGPSDAPVRTASFHSGRSATDKGRTGVVWRSRSLRRSRLGRMGRVWLRISTVLFLLPRAVREPVRLLVFVFAGTVLQLLSVAVLHVLHSANVLLSGAVV